MKLKIHFLNYLLPFLIVTCSTTIFSQVVGDVTNSTNLSQNNGSIDITVYGYPPFEYNWYTQDEESGYQAFTEDIYALAPDVYCVEVMDALCGKATRCFEVQGCEELYSSPPALNVVIFHEVDEFCDVTAIHAHPQGGGSSSSYSYEWSSDKAFVQGPLSRISVLYEGLYHLTVTDPYCGRFEESFQIYHYKTPVNIPEPHVILSDCISNNGTLRYYTGGGSGTLIDHTITGGQSPYHILWSTGDVGNEIDDINEGNYSVTVTDAIGCTAEKDIIVLSNQTPLIIDEEIEHICPGQSSSTGSIDLFKMDLHPHNQSQNYDFLWSTGSTDPDIRNLTAGFYSVTVTNTQSNCNSIKSFEIKNDFSGDITIQGTTTSTCANFLLGTLDLEVNNAIGDYTIIVDGVQVSDLYVTRLAAGDHIVTINDQCQRSAQETFTIEPSLIVNATTTDGCLGIGNIELDIMTLSPPYSVYWSHDGSSGLIKNDLGPGNYEAIVTDQAGCEKVVNYKVSPQLMVDSYTESCIINNQNGSITEGGISLEIIGGDRSNYIVIWSGPHGGSVGKELITSVPGFYTATISVNGCNITFGPHEVIAFDELVVDIGQTDLSHCEGPFNIEFDLRISGTPPYNIIWSNGETGYTSQYDSDYFGKGTYSVTIEDDCGQTVTKQGRFNCNDICPSSGLDCIKIRKTGKFDCTDYCDDTWPYEKDLFCDKIKVECLCDDDQERVVNWYYTGNNKQTTFRGRNVIDGDNERDVSGYDGYGDYGFQVYNKTTKCETFMSIRVPEKCTNWFTTSISWISDNFKNGSPGGGNNTGSLCTGGDWVQIPGTEDPTTCKVKMRCVNDESRTKYSEFKSYCYYYEESLLLYSFADMCDFFPCIIQSPPQGSYSYNDFVRHSKYYHAIPNCEECLGSQNLTGSPPSNENCNREITQLLVGIDNNYIGISKLDSDSFKVPSAISNTEYYIISDYDEFGFDTVEISKVILDSTTFVVLGKTISGRGYAYFTSSIDTTEVSITYNKFIPEYTALTYQNNDSYYYTTFGHDVNDEHKKQVYTQTILGDSIKLEDVVLPNDTVTLYKWINENKQIISTIKNNNTTLTYVKDSDTTWIDLGNCLEVTDGLFLDNGNYAASINYIGEYNLQGEVFQSNQYINSLIVLFDSEGGVLEALKIDSDSHSVVNSIISNEECEILYAGYFSNRQNINEILDFRVDGECSFTNGVNFSQCDANNFHNNVSSRSTQNLDFTLYPNPVTDELYINITGNISDILKIEIIDVLGKTHFSHQKITNSKEHKLDLNNNLKSGVYIIQVTDMKNNILSAQSFIKI